MIIQMGTGSSVPALSQARLYQLKGEKKLTPDGTVAMWTAHFAVRLDDRSASSREGGKKLTVLMSDDRLNSADAMAKCLAILKAEHGAEADTTELKRIICQTTDADGSNVAAWKLEAAVSGSSASATIHAVTAQRL